MTGEKSASDDVRAVGDLPRQASDWQVLAITAAAITFSLVIVAFIFWVLQAPSDSALLLRVQIVGTCAAFGAAVVTFCTVVWRGMITSTQADLQRIQIEKLSEQIVAKDRENLAALFHKGAEMIAAGNAASIAAGISTLQIVATGPDEDFAIQAMNIITDHIEEGGTAYLKQQRGQNAVATLNRASRETGRHGQRNIKFEFLSDAPNELFGVAVPFGAGRVEIINASFDSETFDCFPEGNRNRLIFTRCSFLDCEIDLRKFRVRAATFEECRMIAWRAGHKSAYRNCDFSGCVVSGVLPDLRAFECYYDADNPPRGHVRGGDWTRRLNKIETITADDFDDLEDTEPLTDA